MTVKTTATKTETKRRKTSKRKAPQRETTLSDLQRVTIWELIDRGDGKPPRFERITPW